MRKQLLFFCVHRLHSQITHNKPSTDRNTCVSVTLLMHHTELRLFLRLSTIISQQYIIKMYSMNTVYLMKYSPMNVNKFETWGLSLHIAVNCLVTKPLFWFMYEVNKDLQLTCLLFSFGIKEKLSSNLFHFIFLHFHFCKKLFPDNKNELLLN